MKIECSHDELVPYSELKDHPKNPNTHPEKQIELLAKIIKKTGWRVAITVSKLSGFITRGHGRKKAAKKLGMDAVPVDFQDYESEEEELADMLADNKIPELSKIDKMVLQEVFEELGDFDTELTGYTDAEIDKLLQEFSTDVEPPPEIEFTEELFESSNYIVLKFDNDIDWLQAETVLDLKRVKGLNEKPGFEARGIGRVIDGAKAFELLRGQL